MTGIVLQGLDQSKAAAGFSVSRFYLARARRIIPALAALCAGLLILGWFFLIPIEYAKLGGHIVSALGFFSNYKFRSRAGYFNPASQENWLLHTWSLSVEWQFYLVFPLLLMAAWKLRSGIAPLTYMLATGFILSLALSVVLSPVRPSDAFYLLPTRAWEMLAGGLAYLATYRHELSKPISTRFEALGCALIIVAVLMLDANRSWPGIWAMVPVSGAVAILLANRGESAWSGNALSQWLGTHSYSLYLWHWPIAVALRHLDLRNSAVAVLCGLILTLLLGRLSYRLIETPARIYLVQEKPLAQYIVLIMGILFIAANAQYIKESHGVNSRLPESLRDISNFKFDDSLYYKKKSCFLQPDQLAIEFLNCATDSENRSSDTVLLWGDSFAAHLYPGIKKHIPQHLRLVQMTASGCPPILGFAPLTRQNCEKNNDEILRWASRQKPRHVILSGQWLSYDWQQISKTLEALEAIGIERIDLVGPAPIWKKSLPEIILYDAWKYGGKEHNVPARIAYALKPGVTKINDDMKHFAENKKVNYISVYDMLCNKDGCLTFIGKPSGNNLTAWDDGHLTVSASEYVVSLFPKW
jgi:peptidoglycan/LPS O-acetylase OafA/YrhL